MTPDEVRAIVREEIAAHEASRVVVVRVSAQAILDRFKAQVEQHERSRRGVDDGAEQVGKGDHLGLQPPVLGDVDRLGAGLDELEELPTQAEITVGHASPPSRIESPTVGDPAAPRQANDPTP